MTPEMYKIAAQALARAFGAAPTSMMVYDGETIKYISRKPWEPTLANLFPSLGVKKRKKK